MGVVSPSSDLWGFGGLVPTSDVQGVPHHVTYTMMHLMLPTTPLAILGGARDARRGSKFFNYMQFSAKYLQNNTILGIGTLPQENPGSATAPLPTCEHIDTCENITFSHLLFAGGNKVFTSIDFTLFQISIHVALNTGCF